MQAVHLIADLYQCRCERSWLTDGMRLRAAAAQVLDVCGLRPAGGECFVSLAHGGLAGAVLADSAQLTLRTWPAERSVALDLWMAAATEDERALARRVVDALGELFEPEWTEQRSLDRGEDA
ncbi:S-adenosylmethionine decarboxylase [Ramlibacter sp. AW1]|uniref:S-adenosylmethionine decarboxylase n=1 Tax=Ramlibacter aurantiacus TaxID=2801330 RepID=A0A936ZGY0_9BURK|nr:S-adenosylmethionine decarboxylase [Ramlibacter aurantiacus]MBL0421239.1 S-adenosylmethionine decarboxylase [Ramlibacter aurantiacus]